MPARLPLVEHALKGQRPDDALFRSVAAGADKLDAMTDPYVTADYRRHLARVLTRRALEQAAARANERLNG